MTNTMTAIEVLGWVQMARSGELREWLDEHPCSCLSHRGKPCLAYEQRLRQLGRHLLQEWKDKEATR